MAADQYSFINNTLALKQAAGTLNQADVEQVNTWLKSRSAHTTMRRFMLDKHGPKHKPLPAVAKLKLPAHLTRAPAVLAQQTKITKPNARLPNHTQHRVMH